jgi:putative addiction module component (TIGR02574 family)
MITEKIPAVKNLTPAERLQLAAELWGSIVDSQDQIPVADEIKRLLDSRFEHYQKHPETATTWSELKRRLGKTD